MKPLFMWAGGKNRCLKHYKPILPTNIKTYSEPFFGAGAVFLKVLETNDIKEAYINDINSDIIRIYREVKNNPEQFCNIMDTYSSLYLSLEKSSRKEFYFALRDKHAFEYEGWSEVKEAATLYFLMKTGFNGIWQINQNTNGRFGTPSGLLNQTKKVYDKDNVMEWSEMLNTIKVHITSTDWIDAPHADFTFYDPPYRGCLTITQAYATSFPDTELDKLIKIVEDNKNVWCTNRDIDDGYFDNVKCNVMKIPITYIAGRKKQHKNEQGDIIKHTAMKANEVLLWR